MTGGKRGRRGDGEKGELLDKAEDGRGDGNVNGVETCEITIDTMGSSGAVFGIGNRL